MLSQLNFEISKGENLSDNKDLVRGIFITKLTSNTEKRLI